MQYTSHQWLCMQQAGHNHFGAAQPQQARNRTGYTIQRALPKPCTIPAAAEHSRFYVEFLGQPSQAQYFSTQLVMTPATIRPCMHQCMRTRH